jgi:hypothetical protein
MNGTKRANRFRIAVDNQKMEYVAEQQHGPARPERTEGEEIATLDLTELFAAIRCAIGAMAIVMEVRASVPI